MEPNRSAHPPDRSDSTRLDSDRLDSKRLEATRSDSGELAAGQTEAKHNCCGYKFAAYSAQRKWSQIWSTFRLILIERRLELAALGFRALEMLARDANL